MGQLVLDAEWANFSLLLSNACSGFKVVAS